jgi:DNA helicase-2/ATP-dependent DNA helicase PcrA
MIKSFGIVAKTKNAYDAASHIANQSGLLKDLFIDRTPEGISHFENLQELLNGIKEFVDTGNSAVPAPALEAETDDDAATINADETTAVEFNGEFNFLGENESESESEGESENDVAKEQRTIALFMQDIALLTDADKKADDENTDKVTLMTIHASKGLEFKNVFIVGLEENLFPSMMAMQSRADLEEERRLFYVAITRAERKLYLSYAISRYRFGNLLSCEPSRFLDEIAPEYTEVTYVKPKQRNNDTDTWQPTFGKGSFNLKSPGNSKGYVPKPVVPSTKSALPSKFKKVSTLTTKPKTTAEADFEGDDVNQIVVGMEVEHARFGKGKVISMEGKFPDTKCTIFFNGEGQKQLLLKYAKLKIVG